MTQDLLKIEFSLPEADYDDAVVFLRESLQERVLVAVARSRWPGAVLPGHLVDGEVETLHGPDLRLAGGGIEVPGDGPGVGVWRLGGAG